MIDVLKYKLEITSCGISKCESSWSWTTDDGGFNDYDIWAVFGGHGRMTCGNEKYDVSSGSCLLLAPHTKYIGEHDPEDPLTVINAHFKFIESCTAVEPCGLIAKRMTDTVFFNDLLRHVVSNYYSNRLEQAHYWLQAALYEFFSMEHIDKGIAHRADSNERNIYLICDAISETCGEWPTLYSLAKEYGYSEAYLGRLFHRTTGLKFSEYIINVKIERAKSLLRSSEYSIANIAEQLGYCDSCFFTRQFKKKTGVSPSRYRNGN